MKTLEPISYSTEPKQLHEILSALDSMAVEALAKLQQSPAHSSPVDPDHARIHGLLNAVSDLRSPEASQLNPNPCDSPVR